MAGKPVTRQEALQYDHDSLMAEIDKKKNNLKIFEETIQTERTKIDWQSKILAAIDPKHPDAQLLLKDIESRRANIKTFENAIREENDQIDRDLEMIRLIEKNNKLN